MKPPRPAHEIPPISPPDHPAPPAACARSDDRITCPVCGGRGVEKKQKWFCERCGQLLQTCCD